NANQGLTVATGQNLQLAGGTSCTIWNSLGSLVLQGGTTMSLQTSATGSIYLNGPAMANYGLTLNNGSYSLTVQGALTATPGFFGSVYAQGPLTIQQGATIWGFKPISIASCACLYPNYATLLPQGQGLRLLK